MKNLRLDPFLYKDTCEEHGKNVPFIVEPREIKKGEPSLNFKEWKVSFVFYCKKCWDKYGNDTIKWRGETSIDDYNETFKYKLLPDN